ncbi:hypothetical protein EVAR_36965_1 [Eumeta japonica]|uniref:Uncharacterized protein n=1 Tax=Eumeta variegata TaxID=151549 RepID=A0A4C1W8A4_EUMVA|nr:hypothetical protein EVAR_36965_1 [Eumeta japonica]
MVHVQRVQDGVGIKSLTVFVFDSILVLEADRHSAFSSLLKAGGGSFLEKEGIISTVSGFKAFTCRRYAWLGGEISSFRSR